MRGLVERGGALVAVVAAVGLLAACGASDGTGSKADPSSDEKVEASDSFTSTTAGAVEKCAKVVVSLGEVPPTGSGQAKVRLPLTMTNKGGATCLLRGFPGARLQARDGDTWDLVRTGDAVNDVRLEPEGSATSYLTFLSEPGESGWDVTSLVVTPPNTADSQTFDWPGGPVLRQDAATHPAPTSGRSACGARAGPRGAGSG